MPTYNAGIGNVYFAPYTTDFLENLLVTNPTAQTFALSINGNAVSTGNPAATPVIDVTRAQILNELQNRLANEKQNSIKHTLTIVDNASTIGAIVPQIAVSNSIQIPPAFGPNGSPANPVQRIGQIA